MNEMTRRLDDHAMTCRLKSCGWQKHITEALTILRVGVAAYPHYRVKKETAGKFLRVTAFRAVLARASIDQRVKGTDMDLIAIPVRPAILSLGRSYIEDA